MCFTRGRRPDCHTIQARWCIRDMTVATKMLHGMKAHTRSPLDATYIFYEAAYLMHLNPGAWPSSLSIHFFLSCFFWVLHGFSCLTFCTCILYRVSRRRPCILIPVAVARVLYTIRYGRLPRSVNEGCFRDRGAFLRLPATPSLF